jgi:hypothetical protein
MSFLDKIKSLNDFSEENHRPFYIDSTHIGYIREDKAPLALAFDSVFKNGHDEAIILREEEPDFKARSEAVASVLPELDAEGAFAFPLKGEMFPVVTDYADEPLMQIDRNATIFFGVRVFGLHVNGYTYKNGKMHMWLGRRSENLRGWPGCLDQMVAGGQPIGISLKDNLVKEAEEEALLPVEISSKARPEGTVSYAMNMKEGARRDTLFVYDLELPEDVRPQPDGVEVSEYVCLPVEEVMEIVAESEEFKSNCNLVAIDFFVRHGFLSADNDPDYASIVRGLRFF